MLLLGSSLFEDRKQYFWLFFNFCLILIMAATLDDYDFSSADAGADAVFNSEAGQIRVGG